MFSVDRARRRSIETIMNAARLKMPLPDPMPGYFDVNRDDFISPIDALIVINYLNSQSEVQTEGEDDPGTDLAEITVGPLPLPALFGNLSSTISSRNPKSLPGVAGGGCTSRTC